jgi:hypothetical protein
MVDAQSRTFTTISRPLIKVGVTEFMCTGARPPFDHPHISSTWAHIRGDLLLLFNYFIYSSDLSGPCSPVEELRDLA